MNLNQLALFVFLSIAVGTDLCDGKIYNKWVVAGVLCAQLLLLKDVLAGSAKWYMSIDRMIGMLLPVVILVFFFSLRIIGGGDVKLVSMVGAFVGWKGVLSCMALSLIPAALFAFCKMLFYGVVEKRFQYFRLFFQKVMLTGELSVYEEEHTKEGTICLSVPIMVGVWMYMNRL